MSDDYGLPCEACWWSPGCAFEEDRVGACAKFEHDGFYPLEEREKPTPGASGGSLSGGGCGTQEHRRGGVSGGWNKEDVCSPTVAERTLWSDSKRSVPEDVSHQGERTSATPPAARSCEPPDAPGVGVSRVEVMSRPCRWLRSDVVGTYCSMCGLIVTPGQRCIARPPVRVESCFGDHDMTCRTCALASTDECPAHDFEAWAFPDCPFWTPRAPLPSRPDVPESRQIPLPGFE